MLSDRHRVSVLHKRGITDRVIDGARWRYESFQKGEWDLFLDQMKMGYIRKAKKPPWKGKVSQTGGVVVWRFGVGSAKPPPYARLDKPVHMDRGKPTHYIYRPGYSTKHIDVHPLAAPLLESGEPIYFCLEGSFKADAVLSAEALSISSTSVTTWASPDLRKLLPALRQAPSVYVVPDSDFYESEKTAFPFNPMVRWQTVMATEWLRHHGVNAHIRIPWLGIGQPKVGIDDFLAEGRSLQQLSSQVPHLIPEPIGGLSLSASHRAVLEWLLTRFGSHGPFLPGEVARNVRVNSHPIKPKTVYRAYLKFEELGIMTVWRGATVRTSDGFRQDPHVYRLEGPLHADYGEWLRSLPRPSR